jgi:chemosensory pili system protein ChpA (sensor histidine kinase/response regulator)
VAGRGMGLDVVKNEIADLGGRIEVSSTPGAGAAFTVHLPLTLAVAQALLVRSHDRIYALPSAIVDQVQRTRGHASQSSEANAQPVVTWQGQAFPLLPLAAVLGEQVEQREVRGSDMTLLLRSAQERGAVQVDEVLGQQEVVVKPTGAQLARLPGMIGATVLGDGQIVLIINPLALMQRERVNTGVPAPAARRQPQAPRVFTVMVVDDSLTVRKATSRLLEREGYHVVTARDGADALHQLGDVLPDVMLVDIEMPRMDGFELTRNVRSNPRSARIPIIVITSRSADKHRDYALSLGVNEYLGKPYREEELLAHLTQLIQQSAPRSVSALASK